MLKCLVILILSNYFVLAQGADFEFDPSSKSQYQNVFNYSSLWVSKTVPFRPYDKMRILMSLGFSTPGKFFQGQTWILPDTDVAVKISNNLILSGKVYGFSTEKNQIQVIGSGLQYLFGGPSIKEFVFNIQRVDLNVHEKFRLKSITYESSRWISKKIPFIRIGLGTSFFSVIYNDLQQKNKVEGQNNYLFIDLLSPFYDVFWGAGLKVHHERSLLSIFVQKEF